MEPNPTLPESSTPTDGRDDSHAWRVEQIILAGLLLLSLIGIAIADFSASSGLRYWIGVIPIFAATSVYAGWAGARREGQSGAKILRLQLLHWAPLPGALYVIYRLEDAGRLNLEDAGLVALLSLALTTFLAGVHFQWRLMVVGLLLGLGVVCAAMVEEFFWVLMIPALIGGAVLVMRRRAETEEL